MFTIPCKQNCSVTLIECTKFVFRLSAAPDPTGEADDAPPGLLVGWEGGYPIPAPHPLNAYAVSFSAPAAPYFV